MGLLSSEPLDLELTPRQKEKLCGYYREGIKISCKAFPPEPTFIEDAVRIRTKLLQEILRYGYSAIRLKKDGTRYTCFAFETLFPLRPQALSGTGHFEIKGFSKGMVEQQIKEVEGTFPEAGKGDLGCREIDHIEYVFLESPAADRIFADPEKAMLHTHHTWWGCAIRPHLSPKDFAVLMSLENPTFFCSLELDLTAFMSRAGTLGSKAFGADGFLKPGYARKVAEAVAEESARPGRLKANYHASGMPLVAAQRQGGHIWIYTKLRLL